MKCCVLCWLIFYVPFERSELEHKEDYLFLNVCPFDYTAFAVSGKVGIQFRHNSKAKSQHAIKNFEYTTFEDRLRTVSWSNQSKKFVCKVLTVLAITVQSLSCLQAMRIDQQKDGQMSAKYPNMTRLRRMY